jgi:type III pantothenate kinase
MRTLVLCLGNTSLLGGVFTGARLTRNGRLPAGDRAALQADIRAAGRIDRAVFCSVVPALTKSIARLIRAETGVSPHLLTVDAPHGLEIGYREPRQFGTDRLAAALGARALFPDENAIVVDCGTATTLTALDRRGTVLGGAILPGLALWPDMLAARTAQLPRVAVLRPRAALGRSTRAAMASGVFHGHAGAIRELTARIGAEAFGRRRFMVIGTGGAAPALRREKLFTRLSPWLILYGLRAFSARVHDHA